MNVGNPGLASMVAIGKSRRVSPVNAQLGAKIKGIKSKGEVRSQYHDIIDLAPTILDVTDVPFKPELQGIKQLPMDGVSMSYSFDSAAAPSTRSEQYYELWGNRAIYKDG